MDGEWLAVIGESPCKSDRSFPRVIDGFVVREGFMTPPADSRFRRSRRPSGCSGTMSVSPVTKLMMQSNCWGGREYFMPSRSTAIFESDGRSQTKR